MRSHTKKPTEKDTQDPWSDNSMIHSGTEFDWWSASREEIYVPLEGLLHSETGGILVRNLIKVER